jgi:ATP-dependent RNA helicase DDX49/DBP8
MFSIHSNSEDEAASIVESSNANSGSDVDFPEETPRKRRRISSTSNEEPTKIVATPSAPSLSRIKAKKPAVSAQKSKEIECSFRSTEIEDSVSTPTVKLEKTTFANIDVHSWLVRSLANMAITRPTGIQKGCIPEILKGRDCIGGSRTGSGKTVAFAVPILQKWAEDPVGIFGVVLTPTRYVTRYRFTLLN